MTLRNGMALFVEGGYQQAWWLFSQKPPPDPGVNNFEGYWGWFGRVGFSFQF